MAKYEIDVDKATWTKFLPMTDSERVENEEQFIHILENMEPKC